ncbi:MAG: type I methionyl aminopeptidase [Clostridia bacterium]|nr:type I methionyl aminopeptidase [Oscillospiraceae bacterium]MBR6762351.1 type I methionyl aminopeptidase [Clostridia bacterium]
MITIKSPYEIECMRCAGKVAGQALAAAGAMIEPGVTTHDVDMAVRKVIADNGMIPSFLGYGGFPAAACVSINDEVIHGIPGKRVIKEGDLVKIDVGATYKGYHGDTAGTFACGKIAPEAEKLITVTRQSFYEGIKFAREGQKLSNISHAIQKYCEDNGFSVVRKFVGHGVGANLHEDPEVPNFGEPGHGPRLRAGMTIAIEPMVNAGTYGVRVLSDGWTVLTLDHALSAHYEHTVLITDGDPVLLTLPE